MQLNVTQANINALNKCSTSATGPIMGASPYHNSNNPLTILLAICNHYRCPPPAEKQANNIALNAPRNPAQPIKTYFDHLEDCYIAALIAMPHTL